MKIAIVKLSALGDIVHAMVVLQFIKKLNKKIKIDWIVEEKYKDLLENHPHINKLHTINLSEVKKKKSIYLLLKELSRFRKIESYDLVIDMQGLIKSAIIARIIPSKITIGFDKNSLRERLSAFFYSKSFRIEYSQNIILRNVKLISNSMNFDITNDELENKNVFLFSKDNYSNNKLSSSKKNILIIPGASNVSKCYSIKKLAELTTLIDANFLIIWGNSKEKVMADEIKRISPKVTVCSKLSIDSLITLISRVNLVIGPDTGPTHMAWGLNIPSISLYGPTPGYRNSFVTDINKVIESDSKVNPYKINKNDYSINTIKVKTLYNLTKKLLKSAEI